jgi:dihydroorotate dehydrogenase
MPFDWYRALRPALFAMDAEDIHHLAVRALRGAAKCGVTRWLDPRVPSAPVQAMGLTFPNVLGLAAGLDKAGTCVDGFGALGFGHIEVGTITPRPQSGNPKPRLFRLVEHEAIINRMGFNNPGIDQAVKNVSGRRWRGILGCNIGKNFDTPITQAADDYLACLRGACAAFDYIAVNISSPNTAGLRDLQQETATRDLVRKLKNEQARLADQHGTYKPLAVKIAPDLDDDHVRALADIFVGERIDAVIATNTTVSRQAVATHALSNEPGGLSGVPVRDRSTAVIRLLRAALGNDIPIIGVGGIMCAADALEKLDAGARLVQIYTGLIYRGPALIREILEACDR